jgi:phosphoenolpyruvate synthase/pyruvate phosphate dikinase
MRSAQFLAHDGLADRINAGWTQLDTDDVRALAAVGAEIRAWSRPSPSRPIWKKPSATRLPR